MKESSSRPTWRSASALSSRAALELLLAPISWIYGACARLQRGLHEVGALRRSELPVRVVSVGSLVAGGASETPLAAWVAIALRRRGHRVALCTRGCRGSHRSGRVLVVSDGRRVRSRAEIGGDESIQLAALAPGVPVLACRSRARAGLHAFAVFGSDVVVLDDGFQQHSLERDVDLVAVEGPFGFGNRKIRPRGPLREPLSELRRADAIAVVDGPLDPEDESVIRRFAPDAMRTAVRRKPVAVRPLRGGDGDSPEILDGAAIGLVAGIARPASLRHTLLQLGARIVAERVYPDHHRYRRADLQGLAREAPLWITTAVDALKITPDWIGNADLRVLEIEIEVTPAEALLDWLDGRLRDSPFGESGPPTRDPSSDTCRPR